MNLHELVTAVATQLSDKAKKPDIFGYQPNPGGQIAFHQSEAVGRLLAGSNRSGKSVAGIVEDTWWLTGKHPYIKTPEPPVFGRIITVDFDYGADQIIEPMLAQWIPPSELINSSWQDSYNRNKHLLTLRNGSKLEIKAHGQALESFAGTPRHFLHVDEECPKNIFIESKARLIDYNGRYWITMTPVEGMTWVYADLVEGDTHNIEVFEIKITDNPHITQEAIDTLASDLDAEERRIRIEGQFVPRGGLILREFDRGRHVIREGIPPRTWDWYVSIDHGYNNPTAIYWHGVSPNGDVVTFFEHYKAEWTVAQHVQRIHEINSKFGKLPALYIGDPSMSQRSAETGASILDIYRQLGINVMQAKKDVHGRIDKMNEYLQNDKWHITKNCPNLIKEIPKYRWKTYTSGKIADMNNRREEPQKKDDHGIDSCGYFFNLMPRLLASGKEKFLNRLPRVSKTVTDPEHFPWKVDSNIVNTVPEREPVVGWGEVL